MDIGHLNEIMELSCLLCLNLNESNLEHQIFKETNLIQLQLMKIHFKWIELKCSPKVLCSNCSTILIDFHKFIKKIENVHKKMTRKFLCQKNETIVEVKIEEEITRNSDVNEKVEYKSFSDEFNESKETTLEIDMINEDSIKKHYFKNYNSIKNENKLLLSENKKEENKIIIMSQNDARNKKNTEKNKNKSIFPEEKQPLSKSRCSREVKEFDEIIASYMKLKCNLCEIEKDTFALLKKHFRDNHQDENGYVICCSKKYYKRFFLLEHIKAHLDPDILKCNECDKRYSSLTVLREHVKKRHTENLKKIIECHCGEKFISRFTFSRHEATHIPEEEWKFVCDKEQCTRRFASNFLLSIHKKSIHYKKKKICQECGAFVKSQRLKQHLATHSENKIEVSCEICNAKFKSKNILYAHRVKHRDAGKIFKCPTCGKISPHSKALKKHIDYAHAGKLKLHKCPICEKEFKRPYVLKQHIAAHSGTPLFSCNYCGKQFYFDSRFSAHKRKSHPLEYEIEKATKKNKTNFRELNKIVLNSDTK